MVLASATAFACSLVDLNGFSSGASADTTSDASSSNPPAPNAEGGASGGAEGGADATARDLYVAEVSADQPTAWYRFEDPADANTAKDEAGGHTATLTSGTVGFGSEGARGRGLHCDGSGALEVGDVFDFDGKAEFTLELWVKPQKVNGDQRLISKRKEGGELLGYIVYLGSDTTVHFEDWGVDLTAWSTTGLPTTEYTHIAIVVSYATGFGNAKLYLNAKPQPQGGWDNKLNAPNTDATLRFFDGFRGFADELAIYAKPLSPERVLAHYRAMTQ